MFFHFHHTYALFVVRFSSAHYANDLQEISEISSKFGIPSVGILRQESLVPQGSPGIGTKPVSPFRANNVSSGTQNSFLVKKQCFSVFSTNFRHTEILNIENGRQNCFLSIIIFVIESLKNSIENSQNKKNHHDDVNEDFNHENRGNGDKMLNQNIPHLGAISISPLISDLCYAIFKIRSTANLVDYLLSLGLDINYNRNDNN